MSTTVTEQTAEQTERPSVARLKRITDTTKRAVAAAEKASSLSEQIDALRGERNDAMAALLATGEKRVRICELLNITRPTANKVLAKYDGVPTPDVRNPAKVALARHTKAEKLDDERREVIAVRDEAVTKLLFDPAHRMSNADVARLTGIHRVRVAQLRREALGQ